MTRKNEYCEVEFDKTEEPRHDFTGTSYGPLFKMQVERTVEVSVSASSGRYWCCGISFGSCSMGFVIEQAEEAPVNAISFCKVLVLAIRVDLGSDFDREVDDTCIQVAMHHLAPHLLQMEEDLAVERSQAPHLLQMEEDLAVERSQMQAELALTRQQLYKCQCSALK